MRPCDDAHTARESETAPALSGRASVVLRATHTYFVHTSGDTHTVLRDNGGRHHEHS